MTGADLLMTEVYRSFRAADSRGVSLMTISSSRWGRRLAAERIPGFFEHAHHLLTVGAALKFGEAIKDFHGGHAVIGYCQDARLAVPVYETAFALDRLLRARGERDRARITIVTPEKLGGLLGGDTIAPALRDALDERGIEFAPDFPVSRVTEKEVWAGDGQLADAGPAVSRCGGSLAHWHH
jgi:NADPH-dependent 2,4-dienoyl-CoA reductase/sulfur reductase-like enzyme